MEIVCEEKSFNCTGTLAHIKCETNDGEDFFLKRNYQLII